MKIDARKLTDALVRLEQACDALPQIAEQTRAEALGHAIIGARANIYDTAPGAYERTQDYLRGLDSRSRATRNTASVTVLNRVEYAAYVEFGSQVGGAALLQTQAMLAADPAAPFTVGRSGQRYLVPGPVLTGAQVFAAYRLRELFAEKVRAVR